MRDREKTKDQLVSELAVLRQKVAELEASETGRGVAGDMPRLGEGWYRRIIDTSYEGVWMIDTEEKTEYANRRMAEMLGCTTKEMIGRSAFDFVYEADLANAERKLEQRKRGVGELAEFRQRRKDGSELWVVSSTSPIQDEGGETIGVLGMVTDITERKRAEKEIATRNRQQGIADRFGYRALSGMDLQALMNEAVILVAETLKVEYGKVVELLPEGDELLLRAGVGYEEGLVGRATEKTGFGSQAGYTLLSEEPVIIENLREEERFSASALLRDHGVASGMSVIVQGRESPFGILGAHTKELRTFTEDDINFLQAIANVLAAAIERKRDEEELAKRMETLGEQARLLDLAHDAILVRAMNGTINFWNRGAEDTYGWSREEAVGKSCPSLLKKRFPEPLEEIEAELLREGHWEGELVHTKRDGTQAVVSSRWALERDDHGQPSAILEINSDVTEHKQLEFREHEARHQLHTALKALRESEARFKRLAEVNVIGVGVADLSGNILEANEAFLQMVGYTQEDLL
jgi:PAS domain S-box-containing protein